MSGTSLDGLDMALCRFHYSGEKWSFEWIDTGFVAYDQKWKTNLSKAYHQEITELDELHHEYGKWIGLRVCDFLREKEAPAIICSHGHTIKHEPDLGITFQLGDGRSIAKQTGITTIADFRTKDVTLGGQGTPLVPIGDQLLFAEYDACLNLGGFSNISFEKGRKRIAFDICPVNIVINALAAKVGKPYDEGGNLARKGRLDQELLDDLMAASSTILSNRNSLAREWVEKNIDPLFLKDAPVADQLRTMTEYAALMIANVIRDNGLSKLLVTGGGAYNSFLMERISIITGNSIEPASQRMIEYKESLIFAFLGVLRYHGIVNVLSSVTGASEDSVSGEIFSA